MGLALWLAPVVSTLPLIPFFAVRLSPFYLGTLMGEASQSGSRMDLSAAWTGPVLSGIAVLFDGTIFGYILLVLLAFPLYFSLQELGGLSARSLLIAFAMVGVAGSQFAHMLTNFREPGLREFANGPWSPLLGLMCGLVAGAFVICFPRLRIPRASRQAVALGPVFVMAFCLLGLLRATNASAAP